ncbi:MAG: hypothetical protein KGI60_04095 [Patescibacteria group bacterium]|nr:hypothetical protein [Patescibacteria group bacterium]
MTRNKRRILFYLFTLIFVLITVSALFYSNGWRFDWETITINQLGGIYFAKIPDGATLTIDKVDLSFNPNFFRSSIVIANLFPKTYTAHVVKDGYQSWTKEINVEPALVTEVTPVVLLPQQPDLSAPVAEKISDFWTGPGNTLITLKNGKLSFGTHTLPGSSVVAWSTDGSAVLTEQKNTYYLVHLNNSTSALNVTLLFANLQKTLPAARRADIRSIRFQPGSATALIARTSGGLYQVDTKALALVTISGSPVRAFDVSPNEVLYATATSSLMSYSFGTQQETAVAASTTPADITALTFNDSGDFFTAQNGAGKLVLVNRQTLAGFVVAQNARTALFAPKQMKLAFTTANQELVIYTYGKNDDLLDTPKTEVLRISGEDEQLLAWDQSGSHLFMQYPDALYLLEGDNMPPINLQSVADHVQKYLYDTSSGTLSFLRANSLYQTVIQ